MGIYRFKNDSVEEVFLGDLEVLKKEWSVETECETLEDFLYKNKDFFGTDAYYFYVEDDKIGKMYEDVVGVQWKYIFDDYKEMLAEEAYMPDGKIHFGNGLKIKGTIKDGKILINDDEKMQLSSSIYF